MSTQVPCPRCNELVDSQARICPHCGVVLVRAALLAEQALTTVASIAVSSPMTPEILVPRIGDYLLERGVLNQVDLDRALAYHRKLADEGRPRLVGQVLLDFGLVDRETLDQVITEQILQLQSALQQTNRQLEQRVEERTSELRNALSKLSELNQLKSNFISNVSHELRTPLTHLRGYLDLMADGSLGKFDDKQESAIQVMLRSESRLEELINELIEFSLASSGALTLELKPVDMRKLVLEVVGNISEKARSRSLAFEMRLPDNLPLVKADEEKISWVVRELVDNAIKFTPSGGQVEVVLRAENRLVFCSVKDTGIGISPEHIRDIFEPFHQLDGSITRRYGGVGLGLALVRRIVEAHGAMIKVSSEEKKGSKFEFFLSPDEGRGAG